VSGSGISWAICKSGQRYGQTTTPAPHHSEKEKGKGRGDGKAEEDEARG